MLFRGLSFEKTEDLLGSEAGVGTSGGTYGQAPAGVEAASGRRALREEDGLCIGQPGYHSLAEIFSDRCDNLLEV
jgi:hypothetical protein